jgi:hypothetical protein
VLVPLALTLLFGVWANFLQPPAIPRTASAGRLFVATDPPRPVSVYFDIDTFIFEQDIPWPPWRILLGGPEGASADIELKGLKPGTQWTIITCDLPEGTEIFQERLTVHTRPITKADLNGDRGDLLTCAFPGNVLFGVASGSTVKVGQFQYHAPSLAASRYPYIVIDPPVVQFPSAWVYVDYPGRKSLLEVCHSWATFSPPPNYIVDSPASLRDEDRGDFVQWTWHADSPLIYGSVLTAHDVNGDREAQRAGFYSGILFGVAASALLTAVSEFITRLTALVERDRKLRRRRQTRPMKWGER